MKKLLLSLTLILSVLTLTANPVDYQTARTIAENFAIAQNVQVTEVISLVPEQTFTQLYVFGFRGQKGFVIISADDRAIPILGYSLTTEFRSTNLPDHILAWLHDYENQISWLIDHNIPASEDIHRRWNELQGDVARRLPANPNALMTDTIVPPLITTTWAQGTYYNNLCPMVDSQHCVTGCVATAMAQVMKYWNHPTSGHGSHSYKWNGKTLTANFANTTYDWADMPDSLNQFSTTAQVNAIATLMYHVGVSVNMKYGTSASSAGDYSDIKNNVCAEYALRKFFNYSNSLRSIKYWLSTDADWKATLKNELDNERPVLYGGSDQSSGHEFICDGYDSLDFFHFNWGWGGSCDGFYAIGALNPGSSGTGGSASNSYNICNVAIIGIEPIRDSIPSRTIVTTAVNDSAFGYVTGAGTYSQYKDIKLTAFAREGYRFDHWSDGSHSNPRYTVATSDSLCLTAYFQPISGDTLGYCDILYYNYLTNDVDTLKWGIRLPSSALKSHSVVDVVQYYPIETGNYTVVIYQGDSTNMTPVYSEEFYAFESHKWIDFVLAAPCPIDSSRSLWITLKTTDSENPMTASDYFSGNPDGVMCCDDSVWYSCLKYNLNYSFMIRALVSDSDAVRDRYVVTAVSAPDSCGTVTPESVRLLAGSDATFTTKAARNCKFVMWSDSCLTYKRTITPTSDTTLTAVFEPLRADTTTYCVSDSITNTLGYNKSRNLSHYWAVLVRPGLYSQSDSIRSIMIFDYYNANVELAIYTGDSTSGTPIHSQSFTMTRCKQWIEVKLTKPVPCPVNEKLWVTFGEQPGSLAASASRYSANTDGSYYSTDGVNWKSVLNTGRNISWMVKVITNHNDTPATSVQDCTDGARSVSTLAPNPIHAGETAYIYGDWTDAELDGMLLEVLTIDGRTITRTTPQSLPIAIRGITAPGTYIIKITTGTGSLHIRKLTVN